MSKTCTANVTVKDNVKPDAQCKAHTVQLDDNGNGSLTANDIDNNSDDACGIKSLSAASNTFTCENVGANTVTLTVTDENDNVKTCTANVTVKDNVKPDAQCKDITLQLNIVSGASILPVDIDDGSNDACGIESMEINFNKFGCDNRGMNTITLTVTDNNGNVETCTSTVTIEDDIYPCCTPTQIVYVNENTPNDNDGSDWSNAFKSLQRALESAERCPIATEIWVAEGTYRPDDGTFQTLGDREASFKMVNGISIYGGLNGNEPMGYDMALRNLNTSPSVLSGDIGILEDAADNSYHVVFNEGSSINSTSILDGFVIRNGNANGLGDNEKGGGMYNENDSPNIRNVIFIENHADFGGGGIHNNNASPKIENCFFDNNTAKVGAAIQNSDGTGPTISGCTFTSNTAISIGGGIFNISTSSSQITNCRFLDNSADFYGGGIHNVDASPNIVNCIFHGNTADEGSAISTQADSSPKITNCTFHNNDAGVEGGTLRHFTSISSTVTNCIFWGNNQSSQSEEITNAPGTISVSHSIVWMASGIYPGTGNLNTDPLFSDQVTLQLSTCSPGIDAGTNAVNPQIFDISGNSRLFDATGAGTAIIDMGAYELQNSFGFAMHMDR